VFSPNSIPDSTPYIFLLFPDDFLVPKTPPFSFLRRLWSCPFGWEFCLRLFPGARRFQGPFNVLPPPFSPDGRLFPLFPPPFSWSPFSPLILRFFFLPGSSFFSGRLFFRFFCVSPPSFVGCLLFSFVPYLRSLLFFPLEECFFVFSAFFFLRFRVLHR